MFKLIQKYTSFMLLKTRGWTTCLFVVKKIACIAPYRYSWNRSKSDRWNEHECSAPAVSTNTYIYHWRRGSGQTGYYSQAPECRLIPFTGLWNDYDDRTIGNRWLISNYKHFMLKTKSTMHDGISGLLLTGYMDFHSTLVLIANDLIFMIKWSAAL